MSKPLTKAGTVTCGHSGTAVLSANNLLRVDNQSVIVKSNVEGATFPPPLSPGACTLKDASDNAGIKTQHCTKVPSGGVTSGEATKLRVGNSFVILDDKLAGKTDGIDQHLPTSALAGTAVQTRLRAV